MGPLLEVRDMVKTFGGASRFLRPSRPGIRAVDGVSFSINPGEVVGLVGESGSGKPTIGRTMLKLTDPTAGSIRFDGADITTPVIVASSSVRQARGKRIGCAQCEGLRRQRRVQRRGCDEYTGIDNPQVLDIMAAAMGVNNRCGGIIAHTSGTHDVKASLIPQRCAEDFAATGAFENIGCPIEPEIEGVSRIFANAIDPFRSRQTVAVPDGIGERDPVLIFRKILGTDRKAANAVKPRLEPGMVGGAPGKAGAGDGALSQGCRRRGGDQLQLDATLETTLGLGLQELEADQTCLFARYPASERLIEQGINLGIGVKHQPSTDKAGAVRETVGGSRALREKEQARRRRTIGCKNEVPGAHSELVIPGATEHRDRVASRVRFNLQNAGLGYHCCPKSQRILKKGLVRARSEPTRTAKIARSDMRAMACFEIIRIPADHEVNGPPVPAHRIESTGKAAAMCANRRQRLRLALFGPARRVAWEKSGSPLLLHEFIERREIVPGDRPVPRHAIERMNAEILWPEARHVRGPMERGAAGSMRKHRFDGRIAIIHRIIEWRATNVGVRGKLYSAPKFPVCPITFESTCVEDGSLLDDQRGKSGHGKPPSRCRTHGSGADNRNIGFDIFSHRYKACTRTARHVYP